MSLVSSPWTSVAIALAKAPMSTDQVRDIHRLNAKSRKQPRTVAPRAQRSIANTRVRYSLRARAGQVGEPKTYMEVARVTAVGL